MLSYHNNSLYCDNIDLSEIIKKFSTPLYIYSEKGIIANIMAYKKAFSDFDPLICYAVKASSNINLLKLIQEQGCGFDCVSEGEVRRALLAKSLPSNIIISGVGKSNKEIEFCLRNTILLINAESLEEIYRINQIARDLGIKASIGLRVNPNVDSGSHKKIRTGTEEDKFGINIQDIIQEVNNLTKLKHLTIKALTCHIGSQILNITPYAQAFKELASLIKTFLGKDIKLQFIDIGGGVGIQYNKEKTIDLFELARLYKQYLATFKLKLILEPGRSVIGDSGMLVSKIIEIKNAHKKNSFIIIDAGMNDIIRPAMYNTYHRILPIRRSSSKEYLYHIAGPICESSDVHARNCLLPQQKPGDYLLIRDAGAYCASMASNYNTRPLPAEILITDDKYTLIRKRQTYNEIFQSELI